MTMNVQESRLETSPRFSFLIGKNRLFHWYNHHFSPLNKLHEYFRVEDATSVIEKLTEGPIVLVSLSMGGWLSLVATQRLPERVYGLVLFAPAVNYVYPYYQYHRFDRKKELRLFRNKQI